VKVGVINFISNLTWKDSGNDNRERIRSSLRLNLVLSKLNKLVKDDTNPEVLTNAKRLIGALEG
jgi:hypothetical protein